MATTKKKASTTTKPIAKAAASKQRGRVRLRRNSPEFIAYRERVWMKREILHALAKAGLADVTLIEVVTDAFLEEEARRRPVEATRGTKRRSYPRESPRPTRLYEDAQDAAMMLLRAQIVTFRPDRTGVSSEVIRTWVTEAWDKAYVFAESLEHDRPSP